MCLENIVGLQFPLKREYYVEHSSHNYYRVLVLETSDSDDEIMVNVNADHLPFLKDLKISRFLLQYHS